MAINMSEAGDLDKLWRCLAATVAEVGFETAAAWDAEELRLREEASEEALLGVTSAVAVVVRELLQIPNAEEGRFHAKFVNAFDRKWKQLLREATLQSVCDGGALSHKGDS